jgi:hypothetical protein
MTGTSDSPFSPLKQSFVSAVGMSALGHKLPRQLTAIVSALPPKAAAAVADQRVRFGSLTDITNRSAHVHFTPISGHQPYLESCYRRFSPFAPTVAVMPS